VGVRRTGEESRVAGYSDVVLHTGMNMMMARANPRLVQYENLENPPGPVVQGQRDVGGPPSPWPDGGVPGRCHAG
jgi:hypothetical protein